MKILSKCKEGRKRRRPQGSCFIRGIGAGWLGVSPHCRREKSQALTTHRAIAGNWYHDPCPPESSPCSVISLQLFSGASGSEAIYGGFRVKSHWSARHIPSSKSNVQLGNQRAIGNLYRRLGNPVVIFTL